MPCCGAMSGMLNPGDSAARVPVSGSTGALSGFVVQVSMVMGCGNEDFWAGLLLRGQACKVLVSIDFFVEATAGFEPAIGVLQTPALPLGYVALIIKIDYQASAKMSNY